MGWSYFKFLSGSKQVTWGLQRLNSSWNITLRKKPIIIGKEVQILKSSLLPANVTWLCGRGTWVELSKKRIKSEFHFFLDYVLFPCVENWIRKWKTSKSYCFRHVPAHSDRNVHPQLVKPSAYRIRSHIYPGWWIHRFWGVQLSCCSGQFWIPQFNSEGFSLLNCSLQVFLWFLIPESPRWLLAKNKYNIFYEIILILPSPDIKSTPLWLKVLQRKMERNWALKWSLSWSHVGKFHLGRSQGQGWWLGRIRCLEALESLRALMTTGEGKPTQSRRGSWESVTCSARSSGWSLLSCGWPGPSVSWHHSKSGEMVLFKNTTNPYYSSLGSLVPLAHYFYYHQ